MRSPISALAHTAAIALVATAACWLAGTEHAAAQSLIRGPYLQQPTSSSVIVRWRTDVAEDSIVMVGSAPGSLNTSVSDATVTTEHEVLVDGLDPFTTYYYSVGGAGGTLAGGDVDHHFRTSPETGTAVPTRIWAIGDSGYPEPDSCTFTCGGDEVRDAYTAFNGGDSTADVWLMLGDNAYTLATDAEYQASVYDQYPAFLRTVAPWGTLGNHEGFSADGLTETGPYFDNFTLPTGGEAGGVPSGTEAYYAFDYGNIHFVVLDAEDSILTANQPARDAMLTWLEADLSAATADWIIAFWHQPPYSKGLLHDSDLEVNEIEIREFANPILEDYGVDLVLGGHSHHYERSYFLDGHYGMSDTLTPDMIVDGGDGDPLGDGAYEKPFSGLVPHQGTVYVVAGSASEVRPLLGDHPVMAVKLESLGSLVLDVDGEVATGTFLDDQGAVQDSFEIVKGARCPELKRTGCELAEKARLVILDKDKDEKDKLSWSWKRGSIDPADFGDPTVDGQETGLCVYDGEGLLVGSVPGAGAPPWKASKSTFTYKDKEAQAGGLKVLKVKPRDDGKAAISAKSQGTELGSPAPPLMLPVTAQLNHAGSGGCWEAEFAAEDVKKNEVGRFKAVQ